MCVCVCDRDEALPGGGGGGATNDPIENLQQETLKLSTSMESRDLRSTCFYTDMILLVTVPALDRTLTRTPGCRPS